MDHVKIVRIVVMVICAYLGKEDLTIVLMSTVLQNGVHAIKTGSVVRVCVVGFGQFVYVLINRAVINVFLIYGSLSVAQYTYTDDDISAGTCTSCFLF